ncbi:MAG: HAMP domain-containing histidine kinase [Bacteroidetes bacterium]|nr:HAMP domain-containing histidine kinase [Bacteroidota bacterium]
MKLFGSFRLLTKTTFFYLIFVLITFFVSARYLINKANQYVTEETEHIFEHRARHMARYIEEHDSIRNYKNNQIIPFQNLSDTIKFPQYSDTLIHFEDLDEYQIHRQKSTVVKANDKYYLLKMLININDFTKLKIDIAHRIVPSFIILALIIILFSAFMSGYLLKPFHKILDQMNQYKVGKGIQEHEVKTSTLEFKKMKFWFKRMVNRTEDDYLKLKEYTENMAHEIQTPLAIIRNKAERLIADENVMKEHKDSVKAIYHEANHLSKLGNTLNLLTKIENGEYTNTVQLKTKDVILNHIDSIKELADLKALNIESSLHDKHFILIDPFLFDIILKNLLRNAIRYASHDGPIKIETKEDSLTISNYGDKLKVKNQKIFERFYTSDNSNKSLGLGLSLVKRICDISQLQVDYQYLDNQHKFTITPS